MCSSQATMFKFLSRKPRTIVDDMADYVLSSKRVDDVKLERVLVENITELINRDNMKHRCALVLFEGDSQACEKFKANITDPSHVIIVDALDGQLRNEFYKTYTKHRDVINDIYFIHYVRPDLINIFVQRESCKGGMGLMRDMFKRKQQLDLEKSLLLL